MLVDRVPFLPFGAGRDQPIIEPFGFLEAYVRKT